MWRIKKLVFFVSLILLILPFVASADCPNDFIDVEWKKTFIVSKNIGAIFDFVFELPPHVQINSLSFSLYLEGGDNISEISEFIIYPIDSKSKKLTSEEIVTKAKTTIKNYVDLLLSIEKFDISQNRLRFIICASEGSKFIFTGPNFEGTDKDPTLKAEYIEGINTKIASYINLSEQRRIDFEESIENYNKRPEIIKQQKMKNIRDIIISIIGGIIGGFILLAIMKIVKTLKSRRFRKIKK